MLKRRKNITRDKNKLKSIENSIIEIEIENKLAEDRKQKKEQAGRKSNRKYER